MAVAGVIVPWLLGMSLRVEEKREGSESEGSCDAGRSIDVVNATRAR
jgi:hypothetical protein